MKSWVIFGRVKSFSLDNVELNIDWNVGSIECFHSWENLFKTWCGQVYGEIRWHLSRSEPEFKWSNLHHSVHHWIKEIVCKEYLQFGRCLVVHWNSWYLNSWSFFSLCDIKHCSINSNSKECILNDMRSWYSDIDSKVLKSWNEIELKNTVCKSITFINSKGNLMLNDILNCRLN